MVDNQVHEVRQVQRVFYSFTGRLLTYSCDTLILTHTHHTQHTHLGVRGAGSVGCFCYLTTIARVGTIDITCEPLCELLRIGELYLEVELIISKFFVFFLKG